MWQYNMSLDTQNIVDLDVMVLRTLSTMGPLHGYGVARRIKQTNGNQVLLNKGTVYVSLVRLQQHRWVDRLRTDTTQWLWLADVAADVLNPAGEDCK
jgi:DNA-binding PadR family transcriptional regulator